MNEQNRPYAVRLLLATMRRDKDLQTRIVGECIEDVMTRLMEVTRQYDAVDLPFIAATMQIASTALRSAMDDDGRSLADKITQSTSCVTINADEIRKQAKKLDDEPEEAEE